MTFQRFNVNVHVLIICSVTGNGIEIKECHCHLNHYDQDLNADSKT
jgi:hypothetical protein